MAITRNDALTCNEFHADHAPAGKICTWRRNGATQTWVTRPGEFRIPVKYGRDVYAQIFHTDADGFHRADACPTRNVRVAVADGQPGGWSGIVIDDKPDADNPDHVLVQVTARGASRHRVGSQVIVFRSDITDL